MSLVILSTLWSFALNIITQTFILWIWPVFKIINKRVIEEDDLIKPKASYDSQILGYQFESIWKNEVTKARENERAPSLWKAVGKAYWISYIPGGILILGNAVARSLQPILFARLLTFWSTESTMSKTNAGFYAVTMIGVGLVGSMCQHHGSLFNGRFGMKIRIGCTALLYRKVLRLSNGSLHSETCSNLVNLMTNDVSRFDFSFMFLHYVWLTPIQAAVVIYLLYQSIGLAPIVSLATVFLVIIPIQGVLGKRMGSVRQETAEKTDKRIKCITEIINAIKLIKMSAWETLLRKSVENSREEEVKCVKKSVFIQGLFGSFMLFTERLSVYVTVLYLLLNGKTITASKIFPIQLYFSLIQTNLALYLPLAIANLSEMAISFRRIQEFLQLEEIVSFENRYEITKKSGTVAKTYCSKDLNESRKNDIINTCLCSDSDVKDSIIINNAKAAWQKNQKKYSNVINGLSLRVKQGTLCTIIGSVGAGKSSLFHLILKELPLISGEMCVKGSISYSPQESWLFPGTVRENIIFGSTFDQDKYEKVCEVCCLNPDLKCFPYGDMSLVGERGVSLSGGQRARINLARAVYREADIYLLDDPLSAVDANVGRELFAGCINGYLAGRTRVLVTHQIHFLKAEDHVILIKDGQLSDARGLIGLKQSTDSDSNIGLNDEITVGKQNNQNSSVSKVIDGDQMKPNAYEETRASGGFKWKVLHEYVSTVNSKLIVTVTILILIMANGVAMTSDYWITYWVNQNTDSILLKNSTRIDTSATFSFNLGVYSGLIMYLIIISCIRIHWFVVMVGLISRNLHNVMFKKVIYSTLQFFDNKTTGQILNRFSKDIGTIDELLPRSILQVTQLYLSMVSVFILNAAILPWSLILSAILVTMYFIMLKWYLNAAQAVKRLEGSTKSPVLSMVDSTASGITTIRSLQSETTLISSFDKFQDLHTSACNSFMGVSGAFGMYLDMICLLYLGVLLAIFVTVNFGNIIPVGKVGLAVSQSLALTMMLQYSARFTAELTGHMVAVERALEYTNVPVENNNNKLYTVLPATWPTQGNILYKNISLSYANGKHKALRNVNFEIKGGWKVGIVGRTGSGKSSLTVALFNLSDFEGILKIDNVDIKLIHNQNLRRRITIIPQEPVLFSASLRYNVDPFNTFTDEDIWRALEQVELKKIVKSLDQLVEEGGSNFSVGQRQLICLARAILQSNKILVMDEATANVDLETDALIQKTIRHEFASCTVLTIAHRLNTIMDSDRVLVMDRGEIVEFNHPYTLLCDPNSKFSFMVGKGGNKDSLFDVAKINYLRKC